MAKRAVYLTLDMELVEEADKTGNRSAFFNSAGWDQVKHRSQPKLNSNNLSEVIAEADKQASEEAIKTAWLRMPFELKIRITKRAGELLRDGYRSAANPNESCYSSLKRAAILLFIKNGTITEVDINNIKPAELPGVIREVV